jgi:hypothetical protein
MRLLSWTLAIAATCFLAVVAPASAATVAFTGHVEYLIDLLPDAVDGSADGEVTDGGETFDFSVFAYISLIDPPVGDLFITEQGTGVEILGGLLHSFDIDVDYVALLFGDLTGSAAGMFGSKALVVFRDFDPTSLGGDTSVTISPIPLPASAVLLLSGLGGVLVLARRRKAA